MNIEYKIPLREWILQVTNDILDKFIATKSYLAVVFFKEEEKKSVDALAVLEEIDDDLDELGIIFVKLDDQVKVKRNLAS